MTEYITFQIQNRIGTVTLNRPEKRNALHPKLILELSTAFKNAEEDTNVKVIVLKAKGETFSAGADLEYLKQLQQASYDENLEDSNRLKNLFSIIYHLKKPVIAQVEGDAVAGGCGLASVCDIVFAVPDSRFGYTEVKIGFVPAIVATFLMRKIGEGRSREMLLSGELITAATALQYGLINFVIDKNEIEAAVQQYAQKLVINTSSQSLATTKELLAHLSGLSVDAGLDYAAKVNAQGRLGDDCKKGIAAFINKQRIEW